jgi:hypothetical protein
VAKSARLLRRDSRIADWANGDRSFDGNTCSAHSVNDSVTPIGVGDLGDDDDIGDVPGGVSIIDDCDELTINGGGGGTLVYNDVVAAIGLIGGVTPPLIARRRAACMSYHIISCHVMSCHISM